MRISNITKTLKKIAITSGDPSGIGFEVTAKALFQISKNKTKNTIFFIFRDKKQHLKQPDLFRLIDKKWYRLTFTNISLALDFVEKLSSSDLKKNNYLFDLALSTTAAEWVYEATKLCKNGLLSSLVTGPLSKGLIKRSGLNVIGHTGIFKLFYPDLNLFMGFAGKHFNVLLVTDHIPFNKIYNHLSMKKVSLGIQAAKEFKKLLGLNQKLALLGLNPHSGENGLLGDFEKKIKKRKEKNIDAFLVPDAAFLAKNWRKYSVFICLYHDQGLIPFKMIHGQNSGVHITIGLPFLRTSVDHGTAFDLYNKNLANPASMREAIELNLKILENS